MFAANRIACPPRATVPASRRARAASSARSRATAVPRAESDASSSSGSSSDPATAARPAPKLACPICLQPFPSSTTCACPTCARDFPVERGVADLCLDARGAAGAYKEPGLGKSGTKLFQSDLIASAYENGWRQSFAWAGFPGEEDEARYALDYMRDAAAGGVLLDVSCGSGLFSRRFASSGVFSHVVASDFSESMLRQARSYCEEDPALRSAMQPTARDAPSNSNAPSGDRTGDGWDTKLTFVRADVGRLPFATASLDAVHAGAAMHCWPSPSAAVAEISRVLKPGGVFVASTFLDPTAMLGDALGGDDAVQPLSALFRDSGVGTGGAFNQFWSERELRDLTTGMCGLEGFERRRSRQFIFFRVNKPAAR